MKDITLVSIHLKNFRSFVDEKIDFSQSVGLKMLGGENKREPRLGSNGAGKSTLWNGVCWICYGSGLKNEKTSSLISWTKDSTWGELQFKIREDVHVITRSGPPARIQLDGKPATQLEIDKLLGLSKLRFIHSVIFGQAVRLFPDLTIPERAELFDEVLNLDIWNKASDLATKKHSAIEKQLVEKKNALAYIEGNINGLATEESINIQIESFEANRVVSISEAEIKSNTWKNDQQEKLTTAQHNHNIWEEEQNTALEKLADQIDGFEQQKESIQTRINELIPQLNEVFISAVSSLEQEQRKRQQEYYSYTAEHKREYADSQFWDQNSICPSCSQTITSELKENKHCEFETNLADLVHAISLVQLELNVIGPKLEAAKEEQREHDKYIAECNAELNSKNRELRSLNQQILELENQAKSLVTKLESNGNPWTRQIQVISLERNPYVQQILNIREQENPYIHTLNLMQQKKQGLELSRETEQTACLALQSRLTIAEYWKQGFKRIRLFFVKRILAALQVEIQSAISALGLSGWYISLTTETENKSGGIKLGIAIHVKSPIAEGEWESWSGGESQRLRLAIAMGLASLIQRAAGVRFDLEVFDEPSSFLSVEGIEDLMVALQYRAEMGRKSLWVTDHSPIAFAGFKETWSVIKEVETGSHLVKISEVN